MIYSLAPMEGITGHVFRRVHAECFGALDVYYTPFLPPPRVGSTFGGKNFKEIDPSNNEGLNVVPQLLTKNADEFVWAAHLLAELGYREVNLNLGCPRARSSLRAKARASCATPMSSRCFCGRYASGRPCQFPSRQGLACQTTMNTSASSTYIAACPWRSSSCIPVSRLIAIRAPRAGKLMVRRWRGLRSPLPTTRHFHR